MVDAFTASSKMIEYRDKEGTSISLDEYCELLLIRDYKIVKQETIGKFWISTIWLGIPHVGTFMGVDYYFETMVFKNKNGTSIEDCIQRYRTQEEALEGHKKAVESVKFANEANTTFFYDDAGR